MVKTPTNWSPNPDKADGIQYSDPSVQYSSAAVAYSSPDAAEDEFGKQPALWAKVAKTPLGWLPNPLAVVNLYLYDSGTMTYDSATDTYDGIVSGQDFGDQKTPIAWSPA